jgi:hypothetical protein
MGEYQAILRLSDATKKLFTPLIQIPEIGYDFKEQKLKRTIDEHLTDFVLKKIYKKWGNSFCFVDLNLIHTSERMANGIHPVRFIFDDLRKEGCSAIPVSGLDRDRAYQQDVKRILTKDHSGVCLRISIKEANKNSFTKEINSLLSALNIHSNNCDLVIDLGAPTNFVPFDGFSKAIQTIVEKIPYLEKWRTFVILGSSFPETMFGIKIGITTIPRYEWQLYKKIVANFKEVNLRIPTFGDYTISHPNFSEFDMRIAKPSVKIVYTIDDRWYISKGKNYKEYGLGQYHKLSRLLLDSKYFYDPAFSWGDNYIQGCASRNERPGNLTTWKQVGTNHHIEKVTRDIASFYDSLNTF